MTKVPKEWIDATHTAAEDFARKQGIPELTADEADQFAELGRPDMFEMIGRRIGITPEEYRAWKNGTSHFPNLNLDFMLDLACGYHLNDDFLKGVR